MDESERDVVELLTRERDRLEALRDAFWSGRRSTRPEAYEVAGVALPNVDAGEEAKAAAAR